MKKIIATAFLLIGFQGSAYADNQTYGSDSNDNTWSTQTYGNQAYGSNSIGNSWQSNTSTGGGQTYGSDSNGNSWSASTSVPDAFTSSGNEL
ncbi:MAG TPA: hypothetical protein VJN02_05905 [Gammaproteobacteria bacterium]|nr:hypothetical protein [Gammaproteobacteria bacterium]